jgi:hypothetical protein
MVRNLITASVLVVSVLALKATPVSNVATRTLQAPPPMPGETQFSFDDPREEKSHGEAGAISFRPNNQGRPQLGAVHAAIR